MRWFKGALMLVFMIMLAGGVLNLGFACIGAASTGLVLFGVLLVALDVFLLVGGAVWLCKWIERDGK